MFNDNNKSKSQTGINEDSKTTESVADVAVKPISKQDNKSKKTTVAGGGSSDLASLRRRILADLSPLVDDLDQPPIEKFRTLMMLIQANDDSSLLNKAYQTAQLIDSSQERARALHDIVTEINYFTQNGK